MLSLLFLSFFLQEPPSSAPKPKPDEQVEAKLNAGARALAARDFPVAAAALEDAFSLAAKTDSLARRKPEILDRLLAIFQMSGNLKGVVDVQTRRLDLRRAECGPQAQPAAVAVCAADERDLGRSKMSLNDAFGAAEMFRSAAMDFERAATSTEDGMKARHLIDQADSLTFYAWNVARAGLQVEGQMIVKDAIQILDKIQADTKLPQPLRAEAQRIRETSRAIQAQLR